MIIAKTFIESIGGLFYNSSHYYNERYFFPVLEGLSAYWIDVRKLGARILYEQEYFSEV